jgi:hydrogenase-4 component E
MTVSPPIAPWVQGLSMLLVVTSIVAVESRSLRRSAAAYLVQALIIVALLVCFAAVNPSLYWWAGTALVTKAILTPWLLFHYVGAGEDREVAPIFGLGPSVLLAAALMVGAFQLTHAHVALLAPAGLAQEAVFRTNLAVAATVFALGLYAVLTRRDAIKTVIGLCLLENGVHLSLVSLAPGLRETALFGIATEVVVTAFLLLYVIAGVRRVIGTSDTFRLRELRR